MKSSYRLSSQQSSSGLDGRLSLGPILKCPYPEMVESCALAGFDFVVADMEHTPIGPREIAPLLMAARGRQMELVVRIPENSPVYFKWCLDLGVTFVQVPHVQSRQDAENAVAASRFAPEGTRGLCRFVRAADYSRTPVAEYMTQANEQTRLILQIEGERGARNVDEILSVPGIDTIFLGPYDLSQSLGHPGDIWHPAVVGAMSEIVEKCTKASVRVGTFTDTREGIEHWARRGVKLIEYASDLHIFLSGAAGLQNGK